MRLRWSVQYSSARGVAISGSTWKCARRISAPKSLCRLMSHCTTGGRLLQLDEFRTLLDRQVIKSFRSGAPLPIGPCRSGRCSLNLANSDMDAWYRWKLSKLVTYGQGEKERCSLINHTFSPDSPTVSLNNSLGYSQSYADSLVLSAMKALESLE